MFQNSTYFKLYKRLCSIVDSANAHLTGIPAEWLVFRAALAYIREW